MHTHTYTHRERSRNARNTQLSLTIPFYFLLLFRVLFVGVFFRFLSIWKLMENYNKRRWKCIKRAKRLIYEHEQSDKWKCTCSRETCEIFLRFIFLSFCCSDLAALSCVGGVTRRHHSLLSVQISVIAMWFNLVDTSSLCLSPLPSACVSLSLAMGEILKRQKNVSI